MIPDSPIHETAPANETSTRDFADINEINWGWGQSPFTCEG
jgi:hypothetical protein